jgi:hypothetical protein
MLELIAQKNKVSVATFVFSFEESLRFSIDRLLSEI